MVRTMGNLGLPEVLLGLALYAVLFAAVRGVTGTAFATPTFVLKQFDEQPDGSDPLVRIVGRRAGLLAYILTALGLDAAVEFTVRADEIAISLGSLFGRTYHRVGVAKIASTNAGYFRPIILAVLGVMFLLAIPLTLERQDATGIHLVMVILGIWCFVSYSLGKSVLVAVETVGGRVVAIKFRGSLIEGQHLDLEAAERLCDRIGRLAIDLSAHQKPPRANPASDAGGQPVFCGQCGTRQRAATVGRPCEKCGHVLE